MAFTIDAAAISPYDVILVVTLVTLISYSYSAITGRRPKSNGLKRHYPLAGYGNERFPLSRIWNRLQWFKNGPTLIHDAYQKYPDTIFELPSLDRTSFVLPARFLKEVSQLPAYIANNTHSTCDFFIGTWTTLDYDIFGPASIEAIRKQYISKIGQQIGPASLEAAHAFHQQFSRYPDWTPIAAQPKVLRTIGQMVARTVVGPEICRDPQWVESVIGYAQGVFSAAVYMKMVPKVMWPLMALFTPYLYRIYKYRRRIRRMAAPLIRQRLAWYREQPEFWAARMKSGGEMSTLDWLIESSPPEEATLEMLTHRLIGVSFAGTHTASNHVANCILDLAADFDRWAPLLREEITNVLGPDPTSITNAQLARMWKLDSFMKEVQRFHPPAKLSTNRTLLEPHTLSSGDSFPKDVHLCFAGVPMSMSEEYLGADAQHFDGFRFERMRRDPQQEHNGLQFTSSYAGSLHFGHGRQMCPGRFMGSLVSKLVTIELLRRYDFKLRDGEVRRPANMMLFDMDFPNPTYEVLFRDRKL